MELKGSGIAIIAAAAVCAVLARAIDFGRYVPIVDVAPLDPGRFGVASTLLAALIGGGLTLAGQWLKDRRDGRAQRRHVAAAFRGEIRSILAITTARNYRKLLDDDLEDIRSAKPGELVHLPQVSVKLTYDRVYRTHVGNLGRLPSAVAEPIVIFYTGLNSLLEDLRDWRHEYSDGTDNQEWAAGALQEFIELYDDVMGIGRTLLQQLEPIADEGWSARMKGSRLVAFCKQNYSELCVAAAVFGLIFFYPGPLKAQNAPVIAPNSERAIALDGDTLQVGEKRIRLFGPAAPEMTTREGPHSRAALDELLAAGNNQVSCKPRATERNPEARDRYGRTVASCASAGRDLVAAMLALGQGTHYRVYTIGSDYFETYDAAERTAREKKAGLWSEPDEIRVAWIGAEAASTITSTAAAAIPAATSSPPQVQAADIAAKATVEAVRIAKEATISAASRQAIVYCVAALLTLIGAFIAYRATTFGPRLDRLRNIRDREEQVYGHILRLEFATKQIIHRVELARGIVAADVASGPDGKMSAGLTAPHRIPAKIVESALEKIDRLPDPVGERLAALSFAIADWNDKLGRQRDPGGVPKKEADDKRGPTPRYTYMLLEQVQISSEQLQQAITESKGAQKARTEIARTDVDEARGYQLFDFR